MIGPQNDTKSRRGFVITVVTITGWPQSVGFPNLRTAVSGINRKHSTNGSASDSRLVCTVQYIATESQHIQGETLKPNG